MLRRLWERLARLWRPTPCAACGAPAAGFVAEVRGKLLTKGKGGQPVTKYYVGGGRPLCKKCLDAERESQCRSR